MKNRYNNLKKPQYLSIVLFVFSLIAFSQNAIFQLLRLVLSLPVAFNVVILIIHNTVRLICYCLYFILPSPLNILFYLSFLFNLGSVKYCYGSKSQNGT